jgi:hypothetical protein
MNTEVLPSLKGAIENWRKGNQVWSAELGGIGPGYEQAIQILLWEILSDWGDKPVPEPDGENYLAEYTKFVDAVVHKLDSDCGGFSGAQVGAARATAYQFLTYGYREMMGRLPQDRAILVSKAFPRASPTECRVDSTSEAEG